MPRYQLDDPCLQDELDRLATETAAAWPPLDEAQLARLARLLRAYPTDAPLVADRSRSRRRAA